MLCVASQPQKGVQGAKLSGTVEGEFTIDASSNYKHNHIDHFFYNNTRITETNVYLFWAAQRFSCIPFSSAHSFMWGIDVI